MNNKDRTIVGIDPGLRDTGYVVFDFYPDSRHFNLYRHVLNGIDALRIGRFIESHNPQHVFVEAYRPRSHFEQDQRMVEGIANLRREIPGMTSIVNTGVKQVVPREIMDVFNVWTFSLKSNHQDLRSAARIALYGMLKNPELNRLVTDVVVGSLDGNPWSTNRR